MNAISILSGYKMLFATLVLTFITGLIIGEFIFRVNKDKALRWGEKLDGKRDAFVKIVHKNITKPWGTCRIIGLIFLVNLWGGAFIWSSIGGALLIIPFIHNIILGILTALVLRRFPERINWLTVPNIVFEVAAFIIAAIGGMNIGLSFWNGSSTYLAIKEWGILFITLVIPCQIVAAVFEGYLFRRIYVIEKHPWPRDISKNI